MEQFQMFNSEMVGPEALTKTSQNKGLERLTTAK